MTSKEFELLLQTIAQGWNGRDAKKASECFTDNATYMEPPDRQLIKGKEQLFKYFGGGSHNPKRMQMKWHNIMFNEETQIGAGEYTFQMDNKNHGVAIIKVENGKIVSWREYQWSGSLEFDEFLREDKKFEFSMSDSQG